MKRLFNRPGRKGSSNNNNNNGDSSGHNASAASGTYRSPAAAIATRKQWIEQSIAYSCGTQTDDWETLLALGDESQRDADSAKTCMKSLRSEFQLGAPEAQAQAARILVILWRNSGPAFKQHVASKKFLAAYELAAKKTAPDVRELLVKGLQVLAFESNQERDLLSIVTLYNKLKRPEDPINGSPLPEEDVTFEPMGNSSHQVRRRRGDRDRERSGGKTNLWKEGEMAKNNARVLSETLAFTTPETLDSNELIGEFYAACQTSQGTLIDALPYVERKAQEAQARQLEGPPVEGEEAELKEERVLRHLTEANEELTRVFATHDDMHRRKREAEEDRLVSERSVAEQRMPAQAQSQPQPEAQAQAPAPAPQQPAGNADPYGGLLAAPFATNPQGTAGGSSSGSSSSRQGSPAAQPATALPQRQHQSSLDPFDDPAPASAPAAAPVLAPQRTASPQSLSSSHAASTLPPGGAATKNPFARSMGGAPAESGSGSGSPSPSPSESAAVTRNGSVLGSRNPFANVISQERKRQSSVESRQSSQPPQQPDLSIMTPSNSANMSEPTVPATQSPQTYSPQLFHQQQQQQQQQQHHQSPSRLGMSQGESFTSIPEDPPSAIEPDRNPFHAHLSSSVGGAAGSGGPPPSPSQVYNNARQRTTSNAESLVQTPVEPSEKAYGKLRRFSGMYGSDLDEASRAEEMSRVNETKLRERYAS